MQNTPAPTLTRIPATIVTGFLGSGKTTLLRHILRNAAGRRIAVIVNEFGELGVDGELLRQCALQCEGEAALPTASQPVSPGHSSSAPAPIYELANGCLCCTVQEEFHPVMRELIARREHIDHILIETSGLAIPKPLVQAFNWPDIRNACTVDAVITVVDVPAVASGQFAANPQAVQAQRRQDPNLDHESPLHELFEDQLMAADLVVLSKTDQASAQQCEQVRAIVRQEVPAGVQLLNAEHGRLPLEVLLGQGRNAQDSIDQRRGHHEHDDDEHHHDEHDHAAFDSLSLPLPAVADRASLLAALAQIVENNTIFRIKGFVAVQNKAMRLVVHGVGRRLDAYFDRPWNAAEHSALAAINAQPTPLPAPSAPATHASPATAAQQSAQHSAPGAHHPSQLVFIGQNLSHQTLRTQLAQHGIATCPPAAV